MVNVVKKICFLGLVLFFSQGLWALNLELTQGINAALPIGIASLGSEKEAQDLTAVIKHDLELSGQFKVFSSPEGEGLSLARWKSLGAETVLTGSLTRVGYRRYELVCTLTDALGQGKVLLSKTFQVNQDSLRPLAHHISDEVYQKLTGEKGIFSTRLAYILVQRQGERAKYFLQVADFDGYQPRTLLVSSEPLMSPSWSPDGRQLAYVSFEKKKAQIFTINVETGRRQLITAFSGINGAPAWSADGKNLAVVLSKEGSPKIYAIHLADGSMRQLTFGESIDTEPRYAPDGKSLLFTSGRGGTPQIYRLFLNDGRVQRLTFEGNYNARASYTPDQKQIIMLHREERNFNIAIQAAEGGALRLLTFSNMDESPSLSPNGRLVLYATVENNQGVLGIVSVDGRVTLKLPAAQGEIQEPAWSPYLA